MDFFSSLGRGASPLAPRALGEVTEEVVSMAVGGAYEATNPLLPDLRLGHFARDGSRIVVAILRVWSSCQVFI